MEPKNGWFSTNRWSQMSSNRMNGRLEHFSAHIFFASYSKSKNKNKSLFWAIKYFFSNSQTMPLRTICFSATKSQLHLFLFEWHRRLLLRLAAVSSSSKILFFHRKLFKVIPTAGKLICSNLFSRLRSHGQCSVVSFGLDGVSGRERLEMRERVRMADR